MPSSDYQKRIYILDSDHKKIAELAEKNDVKMYQVVNAALKEYMEKEN